MAETNIFPFLKQNITTLVDLIFPPHCLLCENSLPNQNNPVCETCLPLVAEIQNPFCKKCGYPLGKFMPESARCDSCKNKTLHLDRAVCAGLFKDGFETLIKRLKFENRVECLPWLARKIAGHVAREEFHDEIDIVSCVPPRPGTRWIREFNPPELMGRLCANILGKPFDGNLLGMTRQIQPQHKLESANKRKENVKNAFRAGKAKKIRGKTILLIDDVMTTGATLAECAKTCLEAGAIRVYAACAARTEEKK